jgi:hypothetical protein
MLCSKSHYALLKGRHFVRMLLRIPCRLFQQDSYLTNGAS